MADPAASGNAAEIHGRGGASRLSRPAHLSDVRTTQPPFETVVTKYGPTILRVCRAILGPASADDAWSETFLSALRAYPRLRPESDVGAWLVTIAHRKAIDQLRAESRRGSSLDDLPQEASPQPTPGSWESDLWTAVKALPFKQRATVAYHYLAGFSYAEVAEIVGGSPEAARRAAADGMANLRKVYREGTPR